MKPFEPNRDFVIQFLNFDSFILINREKLATRATEQIYVEYLKNKFGLGDTIRPFKPYTDDFSLVDLYRYYIDIDGSEIKSSNKRVYVNDKISIYTNPIPDVYDVISNLKVTEKLLKLEYYKWFEVLSKISLQTRESVNQILNKTFDKPIVFLYKSPLQYALTSIIQDMQEVIKDNSNLDSTVILGEMKHLLKNKGSIGLHRTPWTSVVLPLIEGNKNIVLVNLDSHEINWHNLISTVSNKTILSYMDEELHNENELLNSNKSKISSLKPLIEKDDEIMNRIYSNYASDFLIYEYLKHDKRNYNLDKSN